MSELRSILYVEDEPDIREITMMALEMLGGFQVTTAGSGEEAQARLKETSVDLLLLDRMLPDTDGFSLLTQLREQKGYEQLTAIIMSARPMEPDELASLAGVIGQIPKPFEPESLANHIQEIWKKHHT